MHNAYLHFLFDLPAYLHLTIYMFRTLSHRISDNAPSLCDPIGIENTLRRQSDSNLKLNVNIRNYCEH